MTTSIVSPHYSVLQRLLSYLFREEEQQLIKRQNAVINQHIRLGGSPDGFRHMGIIYSQLTGAARMIGKFEPLKEELKSEMDAIRTDTEILNRDKQRTQQALTLVLTGVRSDQDLRDALPNCLVDALPQLKGLDRSREEAYTIRDNPRAYSQYMMLREKIAFYAATRLIY